MLELLELGEEMIASEALDQDTLRVMMSLGRLNDMISHDAPPAAINALFSELLDQLAYHFDLSENLMEQKGHLGLRWQQVVHRELLNRMRLAAAHANDDSVSVDRPLLRRIRGVFSSENEDEDVFCTRAKLGLFKEVLAEVHPADLAAALPDFDSQQRSEIFSDLGTGQASGTLEEVDAKMQRELVAALSIDRVAELIDYMTPAQAASVLRNLTPAESWAILQQLGPVRSSKIAALVEKQQNESLLHLATLRYLRVEPKMNCATLLACYRGLAEQARVWSYVYIVSSDGILLGVADVRDILMAEPATCMAEIMMTNVVCLNERDSVETAARLFEHYDFEALPLVDGRGELKGVLVGRDVLTAGEW